MFTEILAAMITILIAPFVLMLALMFGLVVIEGKLLVLVRSLVIEVKKKWQQ